MNAATKKQLKADLAAVLEKYKVSICFTCSDSSDTHGLRGDKIVIQDASGAEVWAAPNWHITPAYLARRP